MKKNYKTIIQLFKSLKHQNEKKKKIKIPNKLKLSVNELNCKQKINSS